MLYKAVEYGRLKAYPLPTKKLLEKEPEFKPRILEFEEAQRLVEFADPAFLRDAIVVYLATGMRLCELLGLPRGDVDFRRRELTIRADRAKNGKARTIPLSPQALEVLKARPGREYFFENPKTGRPINSLDAAWATAKTKAGINGRLRIHDLRDTFATWRLRAGVDIRAVSELIGDSPEVTLKRYCYSDAKTKRAAVEDLPDLIREVTRKSKPRVLKKPQPLPNQSIRKVPFGTQNPVRGDSSVGSIPSTGTSFPLIFPQLGFVFL
jgi:integrase